MSGLRAAIYKIDIAPRLRVLMFAEKLTVADVAALAGVSKSAVEKYLAVPSSPRVGMIASLSINTGLSLEWLIFGRPNNDRDEEMAKALACTENLKLPL